MQTLQFTRALRRIVDELRVLKLIGFLEPFVTQGNTTNISDGHRQEFSALLFGAHAGYQRLNEDPSTARILTSLRVDSAYAAPRLGTLVSIFSAQGQAQGIWNNAAAFREFFTFFEMLRSLASLQKTCSQLLEEEKLGTPPATDGILELQLIDYEGTGIFPNRITLLVSAVVKLYTDLARIHDISGDRLKFAYFDSGSDLVVGVQCAKVIVETMTTLLAEWWDKIKFRNYEDFDKKMEVMSKSLSVMETVQGAVDKKVIDEETANLLKARVLKEVDHLIGIGATLPLSVEPQKIDERKLLIGHRDMKLLGAGESEPQNDNPAPLVGEPPQW